MHLIRGTVLNIFIMLYGKRPLCELLIHLNVVHVIGLPYLPLYNARPCIIRTPILDCTLNKKKEAENRGSGYEKIA